MVKLPFAVVSHPDGGGDEGAIPSGTDCDTAVAAKKSGARKLEDRIVKESSYSGNVEA